MGAAGILQTVKRARVRFLSSVWAPNLQQTLFPSVCVCASLSLSLSLIFPPLFYIYASLNYIISFQVLSVKCCRQLMAIAFFGVTVNGGGSGLQSNLGDEYTASARGFMLTVWNLFFFLFSFSFLFLFSV